MSTESRNDSEKILLHKREVSSEGYIRTDGLFNIEGTITDKKSNDNNNRTLGGSTSNKPDDPDDDNDSNYDV